MGLFKKVFKKSGAEPLSLTGAVAPKPAPKPAAPEPPDEEIVLSDSAPGAEPAARKESPVPAGVRPAGKQPAPPAAPPAPLQAERESIRQVWKEIQDLQSQVEKDYERIQDIASSCGEKDRFLFERVRETQEILGGISDVLAGKSSESKG